MAYKLFAFDLDGTLLDDDKHIPEKNLRALEYAAGQGAVLVPATGRLYRVIPEELRNSGLIRYYILINGACVYDSLEDRMLFSADISPETSLSFLEYADSLPAIYDCYAENRGYMTESMYRNVESYFPDMPHMLNIVKTFRTPVPELKAFLREKGCRTQKLQLYFKPEHMDVRQRLFSELPKLFPELCPTSSIKNNIELNSILGGKGRAFLALAEKLGIKQEETAAFGDGTNDTEMLRYAGCGIAMANAMESVKAAADVITCSNNEGGVGAGITDLLNGSRV